MAENLYKFSNLLYKKNKDLSIFSERETEGFYIVTLQTLQPPSGSFPGDEQKSFPDFLPFRG